MNNIILLKCTALLLLLNVVGFGQSASFLSNFEDQNTDPEIGRALIERNQADMRIVPNPDPDANNNSDYVLKHILLSEGLQRRSEYTTSRMETNEKKYIYTWSVYHPVGMFTDVDPSYVALNQWKTWPCEAGPISNPDYQHFDTLVCSGGGIFNDMFYDAENQIVEYRVRAEPSCNSEFSSLPVGSWQKFVLEVYWTTSEDGYYRIWRNDTLFGYTENIRTLMDGFIEETCDIYWSNGLYSSWWKAGNETTDSVIGYTDNIAIYDIDSGYTIAGICPDCEMAPSVPTDSSIYKININGSRSSNGYNNNILSWRGETSTTNLSSTFGQSTGIDIYLPTDETSGNNSLTSECFPDDVITTSIQWSDTTTYEILLKDLNPDHTYTFKLLSATTSTSANYGVQIWTGEQNWDTVFAGGNICEMAELSGLISDANGDLTINAKSIDDDNPATRLNGIEIVEYKANNITPVTNTRDNEPEIYPNPVSNNLFIEGETVPTGITVYAYDGRMVKHTKNTSTINMADLHKGMYIVLVNLEDSFFTKKIIKE